MLTHPLPVFIVLKFGFQNILCTKILYNCTIIQAHWLGLLIILGKASGGGAYFTLHYT